MATADDTTTKTDWIWLREARDLAAVRFGSKSLALKRLREWMAAGKLRWIAEDWEGLDAAGIEKLDRDLRTSGVVTLAARVAFYNGDPRFWDADLTDLEIDVKKNAAREAHGRMGGAQAEGIKVWRTHFLELVPEVPQEHVEAPEQTKPANWKAGAKPKYDWDAIQARCHQWFNDNGFPDNVSAFCRDEVIPWCDKQYGEDGTPDMETLRPRVAKWVAAWQRSLPE